MNDCASLENIGARLGVGQDRTMQYCWFEQETSRSVPCHRCLASYLYLAVYSIGNTISSIHAVSWPSDSEPSFE